jgi:hypothetical protein
VATMVRVKPRRVMKSFSKDTTICNTATAPGPPIPARKILLEKKAPTTASSPADKATMGSRLRYQACVQLPGSDNRITPSRMRAKRAAVVGLLDRGGVAAERADEALGAVQPPPERVVAAPHPVQEGAEMTHLSARQLADPRADLHVVGADPEHVDAP